MRTKWKTLLFVLVIFALLGNGPKVIYGQTTNGKVYLPYVVNGHFVAQRLAYWALRWCDSCEYPYKTLHIVKSDSTAPLTLTSETLGYRLHYADWSPDGSRIVYSDYDRDNSGNFSYDIYIVDAYTAEHMRLTNSEGNYYQPKWFPDGKKIVFAASEYPTFGGIYTMNADGTELTPLLQFLNPTPRNVMISSDGAKIGFTVDGELYVMSFDGTRLVKITNRADFYISSATWAPTGDKIAFDDPGKAVYVINADGTGLLKLPYGLWQPAWSPDSAQVAYECEIDNQIEICIAKADGTGLITIPLKAEWISWSPDGERLAFTSHWDDVHSIYTVNLDGSHLRQITSSETDDIVPLWQP